MHGETLALLLGIAPILEDSEAACSYLYALACIRKPIVVHAAVGKPPVSFILT